MDKIKSDAVNDKDGNVKKVAVKKMPDAGIPVGHFHDPVMGHEKQWHRHHNDDNSQEAVFARVKIIKRQEGNKRVKK